MDKEFVERGEHGCRDCFHWVACKKMLEAAGYVVSENYNPDATRCDTFTPAADVVEVVHGRWNRVGQVCIDGEYEDILRCSKCSIPPR